MTKLLAAAVAGAVLATSAVLGAAEAQYADQTRRLGQDYADTLRKGRTVERYEERRQVYTPPPRVVEEVAVVREVVPDQFPHQGTDTPSGQMGQDDFYEEGVNQGHYLGSQLPFTGRVDPGALNPQEAGPTYRRGP